MRILFVGHSFLSAENQMKFVTMKQLDPEVHLQLVVPTKMQERFGPRTYGIHAALGAEEVVGLKAWPSNWHMTYMHSPRRMAAVLRAFRPDIVHVAEEPQACITVETIALQRRFAPNAAVTLFTWDNLLRRRGFPLNTVKRRLRAYSLARTKMVVCGNQRAAELLRAEGLFRGSVEIIPQFGQDVVTHRPGSEPELRRQLGLEGSVVIGYAGRLVPEKGLRVLIDALGRLRSCPWKLLLVGAGPLESEIRQRWMTELPGRIALVPLVPSEAVPRYLRCADIFALPSQSTPSWQEQFGQSLTQAMMLGLPCIGSSSGAIPEVLGPGGEIFEEKNAEELARKLEGLINHSDRREHFGTLSREFALRNYTMEAIAMRYLTAFGGATSKTHLPTCETRASVELGSATQRRV